MVDDADFSALSSSVGSLSSSVSSMSGDISSLKAKVTKLEQELEKDKKFDRDYVKKVSQNLGELKVYAHKVKSVKYDLTGLYDQGTYNLIMVAPKIVSTRAGYFTTVTFSNCTGPKGSLKIMSTNTLEITVSVDAVVAKKASLLT